MWSVGIFQQIELGQYQPTVFLLVYREEDGRNVDYKLAGESSQSLEADIISDRGC